MKVIVAVVEEDISHDISKLLAVQKIRCTKVSSSGGALRKGFKDPDDGSSYNANVFVMDLKGNFKY